MGCVHSRHDINDTHANIFQVVNVDDLGHRFTAAMLEVTESHLVLHQRGRAATRWPLRCLRRYGFDAELFSFESGRRCPTGPGIYAFRCRRAEALFNMLQLQIQNITEDAAALTNHTESISSGNTIPATDTEGYLEPLQRPQPRLNSSVGVTTVGVTVGTLGASGDPTAGVISDTGTVVTYNSSQGSSVSACGLPPMRSPASPPLSPPPVSFENNHELSQTEAQAPSLVHERETPPSPAEPIRQLCMNHIDEIVTYENHIVRATPACANPYPSERCLLPGNSIHSKRPRSYINFNSNKPLYDASDQVYVNIVPERDPEHVYVNFGNEKDVPAVPPRHSLPAGSAGSGSSHSGTTTTTDTDHQPSTVQYCILDLDPGSDSSQAAPLSPLESVASGPESPHRLGESYAKIDFDKTAALSNTAKQAPSREDGSRRTRHNSNFTSPASLIRHNSSLSD